MAYQESDVLNIHLGVPLDVEVAVTVGRDCKVGRYRLMFFIRAVSHPLGTCTYMYIYMYMYEAVQCVLWVHVCTCTLYVHVLACTCTLYVKMYV